MASRKRLNMSAEVTLRSNKTGIQRALCSDYGFILNKVFENDLITKREYNNLKHIPGENEEKHVVELVDKIMGKGEERCQGFLDLLQTDEEIKKTYPELKKMKKTYPELKKMKLNDARSRPVQDDFYPMNSQPVGLCLIINNVNFINGNVRYGSDKDAKSLAEVFSWLGFRVLMCKDQTKDQMERTLTWFASLTDPAQLQGIDVEEWSGSKFTKSQPALNHGDAFICCVLSHGDRGVVEGVDWKPFSINDITRTFKATEQSALTGKPKVFLIQAPQGSEILGRVELPDQRGDNSGSSHISAVQDVLVALATVEGFVSIRHRKDGSWFVQSVCQQLRERCPSGEDLTTILHYVNNEVGQKEGSKQPGKMKQMPVWSSTLTKRLKLSPRHN